MGPTTDRVLRWRVLASHVPAGGQGGGMIRYAVELIAALHRRDDVEISVLVAPQAAGYFGDLLGDPARVHTLPPLPVTGNALLEHVTRYAERGAPVDVVHGTKHLIPLRSRAARVLTVHDLVPFERPQDFGPVKRGTVRLPYRASIARSHAMVCVSEATRTRLHARFPAAAGRATTVPLAVSSELLAAVPEPVRALHGKRFALVVGDDSYRKNLGMLVDAWPEVIRRDPGLVLAVAGPPSWAGSSRGALFERLSAAGSLVALGRIPDAQLRWCYEHAVVALCPSLLEGFGLPAIEALAFDAPLITSTDPALVEASGDRAAHVPPDRPTEWVEAVLAAGSSAARGGAAPPVRTWDDVAAETVAAVRALSVSSAAGLTDQRTSAG